MKPNPTSPMSLPSPLFRVEPHEGYVFVTAPIDDVRFKGVFSFKISPGESFLGWTYEELRTRRYVRMKPGWKAPE